MPHSGQHRTRAAHLPLRHARLAPLPRRLAIGLGEKWATQDAGAGRHGKHGKDRSEEQ
jgi:hypothetical protein